MLYELMHYKLLVLSARVITFEKKSIFVFTLSTLLLILSLNLNLHRVLQQAKGTKILTGITGNKIFIV